MDRADIEAHLSAQMPDVLPVINSVSWAAVVDAALRAYGVAEASLAAWDDSGANTAVVRALAEFYALDRALNTLQFKVAISVGNPATSKQANQAYAMVKDRQTAIGERLAQMGYAQDGLWAADVLLNFRATDPALALTDE